MPQAPLPPGFTVVADPYQPPAAKGTTPKNVTPMPPGTISRDDPTQDKSAMSVAGTGVRNTLRGVSDFASSFSPVRARQGNPSLEVPEAAKGFYNLLTTDPRDTISNAIRPISTILSGLHSLRDPSHPAPNPADWEDATRSLSSLATGLLAGQGPPHYPSPSSGGPSGLTDEPFQPPGLVHQPSGPFSGGPGGGVGGAASPEELSLMRTRPGGFSGGPKSGATVTSNERTGGYTPPKDQRLLTGGQKALPAAPTGPPQLQGGPASLPGGSDVVEPTADPRLPAKYASTPVGAPSPPAVMGKANLGEPGPATPQQIPMGRHPAGTVIEGEKVGGRIRPMTEAEIQQLVQSRGTAGRTAAPVEQPTPPPKPKGKK
jgi:hypothetical protein